MDLTSIDETNVEEFVRWVDENGGPSTTLSIPEVCEKFQFNLRTKPNFELDPFSQEYMDLQIQVYRELSGREVNQQENEQTDFTLEDHVNTSNAYGLRQPSEFVSHYQRLSNGIALAKLPVTPKVLDLGCGWGLSSEFLALLGCDVTAIDINPNFVQLVQQRARRLGYEIDAQVGTFESFDTGENVYDAVLFYECFHHAIAPWEVLENLRSKLKVDGKVILAGEPIQDTDWPMWGLRLDPLSVYCIRKFGWFESGWSFEFLQAMFANTGFSIEHSYDESPNVGHTVVATLNARLLSPGKIADKHLTGWEKEGTLLVSMGNSKISSFRELFSPELKNITLILMNYGVKVLPLEIQFSASVSEKHSLEPGRNSITIELGKVSQDLVFSCEAWIPDSVLHNGDKRSIAFHFESIDVE